jgi:hypothetical protein
MEPPKSPDNPRPEDTPEAEPEPAPAHTTLFPNPVKIVYD